MKITGAADNGKVLYTGPGYVSGVVMEFFDIRKMPVNLWRNGAGETREICCFPPATRDFNWRARWALTRWSRSVSSTSVSLNKSITATSVAVFMFVPGSGHQAALFHIPT
jgi:hypothetical protein